MIRLILLLSICFSFLHAEAKKDTIQVSEYLQIVQLSPHTFLHISYIPYKSNPLSCNGLVFIKNNEAIVFDTPVGHDASIDLINWINGVKKATITDLVVNHFHEDCLGGLTSFVGTGCATHSQKRMCDLADLKGYNCTQRYFTDSLILTVGGERIENYYFGAAHTKDNIVSYIPSERMLFGGCMIKELGAEKGNIYDADMTEWPNTVGKVKTAFPKAKTVIPGHGSPGKKKLIDYTIKLFSADA